MSIFIRFQINRMRYFLLSLIAIACWTARSVAQDRYELNAGWKCARAADVHAGGAVVSKPSFDNKSWMPAVVPGTVLGTLIANNQLPDPFYGFNNTRIPDIYTTGCSYYTYWFTKDFTEPLPAAGQHVWLQFRGVNYSYDVFLNGHKLNPAPHAGMYLRAAYDITSLLSGNGNNRVAVIVYPPDPAGNPNGGQGGDGVIARNVCNQYVAGWDWIPAIGDRNTGIWDKVFVEKTGDVTVSNVHVVTKVPGVRMPEGKQAPAMLEVSAELENVAVQAVSGILRYELQGETISQAVTIPPHARREIKLPVFTVAHPKLWWPNGYGAQELYSINVQFITGDKQLSGEERVRFGIRELQAVWNTHTQSRELRVNGQRIFIKGGNWITSDALLRFTDERYDAEVRFHRDMNLNLVRVWGGGLLERPAFYDACDKYGLLVFQDFWVSGDCNGRWYDPLKLEDTLTRRMYPNDHELFVNSVADQVKMVRNHPSLAFWCGGNEIRPPADILDAMRDSLLPALDGTRFFFSFSNDDSMSLNSHDGPYTIQPDRYFWEHRSWPFNSEMGSVGIGDMASLERFMPEEHRVPPYYDPEKKAWITDTLWTYHKYTGYDSSVLAYGPVKSIEDFVQKAQLVNYNQYRALAEGFSAHMWDWYTGIIIWKTQNPWTAMRGQMYDYYLDPNACLYGLKKGAEPLHVMFNPLDSTVTVVNNDGPQQGLKLMVTLSGYVVDTFLSGIDMEAASAKKICSVKSLLEKRDTTSWKKAPNPPFHGWLKLYLYTADKRMLSENLYWLPDAQGNYTYVQQLPQVKPEVRVKMKKENIEVTLIAGMDNVSFFNRISLEDSRTHRRVLPVFYSDNYISLLPGEKKTICISGKGIDPKKQEVVIDAWNGPQQRVAVR